MRLAIDCLQKSNQHISVTLPSIKIWPKKVLYSWSQECRPSARQPRLVSASGDASRGSSSTLANAGGECRLGLPKSFRRVRNGSTSSPEFFFPSFSPFSILVIGHFICCSTSLPNLISYGIDVQCFRANVSLPRFDSKSVVLSNTFSQNTLPIISVTRLGDLLDFGQFFEAFGNN